MPKDREKDKEEEDETRGTEPSLPSKITIRGGLTSSERIANGVRFDHDDLALLASQPVEGPFVIDHGMNLAAIAGQVTSIKADRRTIEVPLVRTNDPKKPKVRKENATFLAREATLTPDNPAFEMAAKTIVAHQKAGKVPHTSIALQASRLIFDEEADEIRLGGPMRFIHDSLVSRGAFSPVEDGVGAMEISAEFSATPSATLSATAYDSDGGVVATMSAGSVLVQNLPDLVAAYSISNSGNPAALAALHRAGLAEAPNAPEPIVDGGEANHQPLNTAESLASTRSHMADSPPDTPKTASQPTEAGADNDAAAIDARLDALLEAKLAEREAKAEEKRAASLRADICEEFDIDAAELAGCDTVASLETARRLIMRGKRDSEAGGRGKGDGKGPSAEDDTPTFNVAEQYEATGGNPRVIHSKRGSA